MMTSGVRGLPLAKCLVPLAIALRVFVDCQASMAGSSDDLPLELRPYRVNLQIAFDGIDQSPSSRSGLIQNTRNAAGRCLGAQWVMDVSEADWLQPVSAEGLSRLTLSGLQERVAQDADFDVWLVAGVTSRGSGWRIDVRCWQPEFNLDSPPVGAETVDRLDIPLVLLRLCHQAFRPIGLVDGVDGDNVGVLLRAGGVQVPDESFALSANATTFAPVLASRKRDRSIERLMPIPWTLLATEERTGARLKCHLHSGLRSPIGGKQRGRVETVAIAVKSHHGSTVLDLATQSKPSLALVAHRVELRDSSTIRAADAKDKDEHLLQVLLTDRRGRVTIPHVGDTVVWLFAYSGRNLLARVPILPGAESTMRLEVRDDSARLEAESDLYMLQGQLIETVAARTSATTRIRSAIKKNDKRSALNAVEDLKKLPDVQNFLDRVTAIRVPSVKVAKARKDRAGEVRINRMCDDMSDLIRQYLSEDKRQVILEELKEFALEDAELEKLPQSKEQP
ncbi:MAG: hypothetical protein JSS49_01865 [Planctomycetes bacterium]|nr:hypothetical protein [Planctomycetota bacterium]